MFSAGPIDCAKVARPDDNGKKNQARLSPIMDHEKRECYSLLRSFRPLFALRIDLRECETLLFGTAHKMAGKCSSQKASKEPSKVGDEDSEPTAAICTVAADEDEAIGSNRGMRTPARADPAAERVAEEAAFRDAAKTVIGNFEEDAIAEAMFV